MYSSCLLTITKLLSYGETTYSALSIMFVFYILVMGRVGHQTYTTLQQNFKLTHAMHYRATHDPLVGQHDYAGQTTRIGIAFNYGNKVLFSQLMRVADSACYQSKENGRNQITVSFIKNKT